MTVAEALKLSRDAHIRYRDALPRRISNGSGGTIVVDGNAEAAGIALNEACRFRAEAHGLDEKKYDPGWADEATTHDHSALLDFYVDQLTREPATVTAEIAETDTVVDLQTIVAQDMP